MALTGRFTFRRTFMGKIVLQVEEEVKAIWPMSRKSPYTRRWRNANLMDLASPELRPLMDLRYKPQFMAQYEYLSTDASAAQPSAAQPAPGAVESFPARGPVLVEPQGRPNRGTVEPKTDTTVEVQSYNARINGAA
jgi:hypothetical protein